MIGFRIGTITVNSHLRPAEWRRVSIKKKHGLKIDVALAAQLTMSTAFGVCMLPMGAPEIPWEAGLSEAALEGLLQFILVRK
jgi:hypothetical protein